MIDREVACELAEAHLQEQGDSTHWIREVLRWDEIDARKPSAYGHDLGEDHWIAYVGRPDLAIRSSLIIAVHHAERRGHVLRLGSRRRMTVG